MNFLKIIKSRFKKPIEEEWVLERRQICLSCPFNSKNIEKISNYKKVLIKLSNFLSLIAGKRKEDVLGNCVACESCSIFYKTAEEVEYCPKNKWNERNN